MKFRLTCLVFALVAAVAFVSAEQSDAARTMMEAARKKAVVDGDLKGAIQQYQIIADKYKSDRAVAADALLRMAECYQKLGDSQAQNIYEKVVREFSDQNDAVVVARARLTVVQQPIAARASVTMRQVWTLPPGGDLYGTVSRNGRYIPYTDWDQNGDLFLRDLGTGTTRRLTNTADASSLTGGFAEEATFSRDGKQLAYSWFRGDTNTFELRLVSLSGTGLPQPRRLLANDDIEWIGPYDWSPDGEWLAVQLHRKDHSAQMGLVAVKDGSLRVLKTSDWRGSSRMSFSHDGRYLAFDLPPNDATDRHDVFVLAVDASREIAAVVHPAHDALLDWSPDGKRLLFASERSGSIGLWALPFSDGKPQGEPELLKRDLGQLESLGISDAGALYSSVWDVGNRSNIQVATVDLFAGTFLSPPTIAVQTFVGTNQLPDWSPDGRHLAYVSDRRSIGSRHHVLGIRSVETGTIREVALSPGFGAFGLLQSLRWAPDGRSLVVGGRDAKGRTGVFRIDTPTGHTSVMIESSHPPLTPAISPDGRKLYYVRRLPGQTDSAVIEHDLSSGRDSELSRQSTRAAINLAPDGRFIATVDTHPATKTSAVVILPTSGDKVRELMRVTEPQALTVLTWTPDSRFVLLRKNVGKDQNEVWSVPVDGAEPRKLNLSLDSSIVHFRLHPDGRQVALQVRKPGKPGEVWVLENFLPALKASR